MSRATRRPRGAGHGAAARPGERAVVCAVLTVSDSRRGAGDLGGARIERLVEDAGHRVATRAWSPDGIAPLRRSVRPILARADVDVVIVTGGTGLAPRDRTPEALAPLVDTPLPAFGECFRALSLGQVGSAAWLSRAGAGVADGRLLVWLPGSPAALDLALSKLLLPELHHAVRMLGRLSTKE